METITNAVSAATNAASNLIYGDQSKTGDAAETTKNNETAGKEPLSGVEGAGTKSDPFDQGNTTGASTSTTAETGTFLDYKNNETGGKEPISGLQGQGTAKDPFDQGNDGKVTDTDKSTGSDPFLKLDPATKPMTDSAPSTGGDPKIYSDSQDTTYTGMKIVPLNPDAMTSNTGTASAPVTTETPSTTATGITDKAGVSEKVWKDTPLDDISRSGAPGSGPTGPAHVTPAAPDSTTTNDPTAVKAVGDSTTRSSDTYAKSSSLTDPTDVLEKRETPEWTATGVSTEEAKAAAATNKTSSPDATNATKTSSSDATTSDTSKTGIAEDKTARKSESGKETDTNANGGNYMHADEKNGKMSHLKEKMKNKLHIGSKDK